VLVAAGGKRNQLRSTYKACVQGCGLDWRWGEALFHCLLVDYDPASNEGNWQYVAGVDLDPR